MDVHQTNKQAWEEAFNHRHPGWCDDLPERLRNEELPYLNPMLRDALKASGLEGKTVAQFCCNNGRELLSSMQLGVRAGYGFDIAENMIAFANGMARKTGLRCTFTACDILDIGEEYSGAFDLVLFTIGAITWFEDLNALFQVAARCLRKGGALLVNDFHPFVNMLPLPGEEAYDERDLRRFAFSYFREEPWLEHNGAGYMAAHQNSHTFTSFSHTMGSIVNAAVAAGLAIASLREYDRDVGMADAYNGMGMPLSFTLRAVK